MSLRDRELRVDPEWAWAPYTPDKARPWTRKLVGHLYRRAAFGATRSEIEAAVAKGPAGAVESLLCPEADTRSFDQRYEAYEKATSNSESSESQRSWWILRMLRTPHPLREKMVLFWHGHFGVRASAVRSSRWVEEYLRNLRTHALGDVGALLDGAVRTPALHLSLDARAHRKALPADHFARAMLEAFTLGPGQATEHDVSEAARAFTGWFVLRDGLRFVAREHDAGEKTVLGKRGKLASSDVIRLLVEEPATSLHLAGSLYRFFVSEIDSPPKGVLEPLAASLEKDRDVGRVVATILRSNVFFSPSSYRRRVKSPLEFAIGTVRALEGTVSPARLGADVAALGQDLLDPPSRGGWAGARTWLNHLTLVERANLARALFVETGDYAGALDPAQVAAKHGGSSPEDTARFLLEVLVSDDVPPDVRRSLLKSEIEPRTAAYLVTMLPEYQLA